MVEPDNGGAVKGLREGLRPPVRTAEVESAAKEVLDPGAAPRRRRFAIDKHLLIAFEEAPDISESRPEGRKDADQRSAALDLDERGLLDKMLGLGFPFGATFQPA